MLSFFVGLHALAVSILLIFVNAQGLHLISEWVFFQYTNVHFTQPFFVGVTAFIYYFSPKKDTTGKSLNDLIIHALAISSVFWIIITGLYFFK